MFRLFVIRKIYRVIACYSIENAKNQKDGQIVRPFFLQFSLRGDKFTEVAKVPR